jgi:putative component of membrane protein insertase Oxa1/YidC/SpoIIIJ protein YidD
VKAVRLQGIELVLGGIVLALAVVAAPRSARAEDETPHLWQPDQAVAFLLGAPRPGRAENGEKPWDGALGGGVTRALFGSYQLVLSSQDLPVCGFSPSCSRFAERVMGRCGVVEGALLSLDRLLRDHPLAMPFYPRAAEGHLLKDDPERYCLTASE